MLIKLKYEKAKLYIVCVKLISIFIRTFVILRIKDVSV